VRVWFAEVNTSPRPKGPDSGVHARRQNHRLNISRIASSTTSRNFQISKSLSEDPNPLRSGGPLETKPKLQIFSRVRAAGA
jgi:hypothetical protein